MRDPRLVETASLAPGRCFTCNSITGPFIDTMSDLPLPEGRIYICLGNCMNRYERLIGGLPKEDMDALMEILASQQSKIAVLEAELEVERLPGAKVISVDQIPEVLAAVYDLDAERKKRAAKPKAAA